MWCYTDDSPVIMMKAYTTLKASPHALVTAAVDFDVRQNWDTAIDSFKTLYSTPDMAEARVSYNFKSPAPLLTSDRDFYIL